MEVNSAPQYYVLLVTRDTLPNQVNESKLCRLCAKPRSDRVLVPMFDICIENQLANVVNKYLPINVSADDKLPKYVCKKCVTTLTRWDKLFITSIEADEKLRSLYDGDLSGSSEKSEVCSEIVKEEYTESEGYNDQSMKSIRPEFVSVNEVHDNNFGCELRTVTESTLINNKDELSNNKTVQESINSNQISLVLENVMEDFYETDVRNNKRSEIFIDNQSLKETSCGSKLHSDHTYVLEFAHDNKVSLNDNDKCSMANELNGVISDVRSVDNVTFNTINELDNAGHDVSVNDNSCMVNGLNVAFKSTSVISIESQRTLVNNCINENIDDSRTCLELEKGMADISEANVVEDKIADYSSSEQLFKEIRKESKLDNGHSLESESVDIVSDNLVNNCNTSNELNGCNAEPALVKNSNNNEIKDISANDSINNCRSLCVSQKIDGVRTNISSKDICDEDGFLSFLNEITVENGSSKEGCEQLKPTKKKKRYSKWNVPNTCPICKKTFKRRHLLTIHSVIHSSDRPFQCSLCSATFKRKTHLNYHRKRVHEGIKKKPSSKPLLNIDLNLKTEVGEFTCDRPNCEKIFLNMYDLKVHTMKCVKWPCNICDKVFSSNSSLYVHKIRHKNASAILCDICGKVFSDHYRLKLHLKLHSDGKKFMCEMCGKCFALKHTLDSHMSSHTDFRPHACPHCPKKFHRLDHVKVHIRTHTGEKPYICHICNRGFAQSSDRNKHVLTHQRMKDKSK